MENGLILAVVALILFIAVSILIKCSGRKGCCGSAGNYKPRKKKLDKVIRTKTFSIEGMHCEKCSSRVTEVVNDIPGAAGIVNLKKGALTMSNAVEIPDEVIAE